MDHMDLPIGPGGGPGERGPGEGGTPPERSGRRLRDVRLVLSGVAAALFVWFAVANLQKVPVHFWLSTTSAPAIVVIVVSGAFGFAGGLLTSWFRRRNRA